MGYVQWLIWCYANGIQRLILGKSSAAMVDIGMHKWDTIIDTEIHKGDGMVDIWIHKWDTMVDVNINK